MLLVLQRHITQSCTAKQNELTCQVNKAFAVTEFQMTLS